MREIQLNYDVTIENYLRININGATIITTLFASMKQRRNDVLCYLFTLILSYIFCLLKSTVYKLD